MGSVRSMCRMVPALAGLLLAGTAHAQIKPEKPDIEPLKPLEKTITPTQPTQPSRPGEPVTPIATPTLQAPADPFALAPNRSTPAVVAPSLAEEVRGQLFAPGFAVTGYPSASTQNGLFPGRHSTVTISLSGLKGMKAVKMLEFKPGCAIEPRPVYDNSPGALSVRAEGPAIFYSTVPVIVAADGTATFRISGRPAAERAGNRPANWDPFTAVQNAPPVEGEARWYNPFTHTIGSRYWRPSSLADLECRPEATIAVQDERDAWTVRDASGKWVAQAGTSAMPITGKPWYIVPYRRVVINDTWRMKDFFSPTMRKRSGFSLSTCEGISTGFHGNQPVGIRERMGDIAFVQRSGPLGTDCVFSTAASVLPEGVRIAEVNWAMTRVNDKCIMGTTMTAKLADLAFLIVDHFSTVGTIAAHAARFGEILGVDNTPMGEMQRLATLLRRPRDVLMDTRDPSKSDYMKLNFLSVSKHGYVNPYVEPMRQPNTSPIDLMEPFMGSMSCEITGSNDHEIAVRIDSVVAYVPEGVRFF